MEISAGAIEIINTARFNPHDLESIERLIQKHGTAVAAETIAVLAQVIPQNSVLPFISKR